MRWLSLATAGLLTVVVAHQADAAVPRSITVLLGPSVGYFLAQSKICGWDLEEQINQTYKRDFAVIGLTGPQLGQVWKAAGQHEKKLMNLPEKAMTPMKVKICSSADKADLLSTIGD